MYRRDHENFQFLNAPEHRERNERQEAKSTDYYQLVLELSLLSLWE